MKRQDFDGEDAARWGMNRRQVLRRSGSKICSSPIHLAAQVTVSAMFSRFAMDGFGFFLIGRDSESHAGPTFGRVDIAADLIRSNGDARAVK
jgi:hypothetical protein